MALNKHIKTNKEPICFFCGKKIHSDEHAIHFQGTAEDGSGYVDTYQHALCVIEHSMIMQKELRFAMYSEKFKLTAIPRTLDANHLKVNNWELR